jgi:hypothetical protein
VLTLADVQGLYSQYKARFGYWIMGADQSSTVVIINRLGANQWMIENCFFRCWS